MIVDDKLTYMTMRDAGIIYDSGFVKVEIDGQVLLSDFSTRPITDEERDKIREIADDCSRSK